MKNFFTVFLRIILVLSFVSVIAFVAVVLTSNVNVAYNSYAYISASQDSAPYEHFAINIDRFVRRFTSNSGSATFERDDRAIFLTNTVDTVNVGINYYVDYLSIEGGLTKAEQSSLNKSYKAYQDEFSNAREKYNVYIALLKEIYEDEGDPASHVWGDVEMFNVNAKENDLVQSYYATYLKGSEFFRTLSSFVRTHSMTYERTFSEILLELRVYFADRALYDIFVGGGEVDTSVAVREYGKVLRFDAYKDADLLVNPSLVGFVSDASNVDLYRLVNDYTAYLDTLSVEDRVRAIRVKSFIDNNILV